MEQTILLLLSDWHDRRFPSIIKRDYDIGRMVELFPGKVIALTGFRRVGKTFLVLDYIKDLLETFSRKEVIYLNLEDERIPNQTEFLSELLPTIKKLLGEDPKYLILDEIQNIPNWSKWVRRIVETTSIRLIITGSSSKMSVTEVPTELRGRYWDIYVHPLTFKEFINFQNGIISIEEASWNIDVQNQVYNFLRQYIRWGGLPEIVLTEESLRPDLAQNYYRTVVYKDITEHYDLRNPELLRSLIRLLLNHSTITISQLHKLLRSSGIESSKNTIANYMEFIQTSFFIKFISRFSFKIKEELLHPRKVYCIDNVFLTAISTRFSIDTGYYTECCIEHTLAANNYQVYYWKSAKNNQEVDFIIKQDNTVQFAIQVCDDLSDASTYNREVRSLIQASDELKCKKLFILNRNIDKTETAEWFGKKVSIRLFPIWKFLLNPTQTLNE